MPDSGTGAVPIPTIGQHVPTPNFDVSASPFHAEPLVDPVGHALEAASQPLMQIFDRQQAQKNAIDVTTRMSKFEQDFGQAKVAALNSGQAAPDMIANLRAAGTNLMSQYAAGTTDPNNPNPPSRAVARELQIAMNQHVADQMSSFPAEAAERVYHDLDFKFNQQNQAAATLIGQNYTVKGTGDNATFNFNGDGAAAAARAQQAIDNAYPPQARPTENQFYSTQLRQKIVLQTGMSVAENQPTLIRAYLNQHAGFLTPEQEGTLVNRANEALDGPMRQIEADGKAAAAKLYNQFVTLKANHQLSDSVVVDAVNSFKLPKELGEQLIEKPIEDPTIPSVFNSVKESLDGATTPEAGEMILAGAGTKGSGINSTDAAKLRAYWINLKPMLDDPIHTAIQQYGGPGGWLDQQYKPLDETEMDAWGNSMNPAVRNNQMAARNYFNSHALLVTRGKDPSAALGALQDLAQQARKLYTPPPGLMADPDSKARVDKLPPAIIRGFTKTRDLTQLPETSVEPAR